MAWSGWSSSEWAGAKWSGWQSKDWSTECKQQRSWASQLDAHENKQDESWPWREAQTAGNHTKMIEEQIKPTWVWRKPASRLWTHIILHIDKTHKEFDLVPRLIGRGGVHMKTIALAYDAKLRVRGKGSGHLEVNGKTEAPVPLMLTVSANKKDHESFQKAVNLAIEHLRNTELQYKDFCYQKGFGQPGPMFSIGEMSPYTGEVLKELVHLYPHPDGPKETTLTGPAARVQKQDSVTYVAPHKPVHVPPRQLRYPTQGALQKCMHVSPYTDNWHVSAAHDAITRLQFMTCHQQDEQAWWYNGWHAYDMSHEQQHLHCDSWFDSPAYVDSIHSQLPGYGLGCSWEDKNTTSENAVMTVLSNIWATTPVSTSTSESCDMNVSVICSRALQASANAETNELDQMMRNAITEFLVGNNNCDQE